MKKLILALMLMLSFRGLAQDSLPYHSLSTGINILSAAFKNIELNNEYMLNQHLGLTCDLGYQLLTNAGRNLNLTKNNIEGYYGRIGPRIYFAPHRLRVTGYFSTGYIYSYFKQSASIEESDFYEPSKLVLSTNQKLQGTYIGLGLIVKLSPNFRFDFGTSYNFFSPQSINFAQDYDNVTSGQPGFGNFITRFSNNMGLGMGIMCSFKYDFLRH